MFVVSASLVWCDELCGQTTAEKPEPAFEKVVDDPNLPRVLLLGDSISIGYTPGVRTALKGIANVHRPAENCRSTNHGLADIEAWLGEGKWDLIHFNWGLHDMAYIPKPDSMRAADAKEVVQQVPVEQYEKQLAQLVEHLQKTGATLIWCSTTPVPPGAARGRVPTDPPKYNAAALRVMQKHNVAVNDLYAFALPRLKEIQLPANVHFTPQGSEILAEEVARVIRETLAKSK